MKMIEHEYISVDFQPLVLLTIDKAVSKDLPTIVTIEYIVPVPDRRREKVNPAVEFLIDSSGWHNFMNSQVGMNDVDGVGKPRPAFRGTPGCHQTLIPQLPIWPDFAADPRLSP